MGSIYRHNEGGAPLAVAECALKEALWWFSDCCASDDPSSRASKGLTVWPCGRAVGFRGWTWCRLVPVDGGFCHGLFFDNFIQKKEKRGRQGPAEHRKMFNRYFGGHVSREDVTCV